MKEVKNISSGGHGPVLAAREGNTAGVPEPLEWPKLEQRTPSYPNTLGRYPSNKVGYIQKPRERVDRGLGPGFMQGDSKRLELFPPTVLFQAESGLQSYLPWRCLSSKGTGVWVF